MSCLCAATLTLGASARPEDSATTPGFAGAEAAGGGRHPQSFGSFWCTLERPIIAMRMKSPRSRTVTMPGFPSRNFSDSEAKAEQEVKRKQTSRKVA